MDHFVIGTSEATEAEYGYKVDAPVTMIHFYRTETVPGFQNDEAISWEGFQSIKAASTDIDLSHNIRYCNFTDGGQHA